MNIIPLKLYSIAYKYVNLFNIIAKKKQEPLSNIPKIF